MGKAGHDPGAIACCWETRFFFFYMFSCAGCVISDFMHSHIYPVSVESDFLTVAPSNLVAVYFMYCSE